MSNQLTKQLVLTATDIELNGATGVNPISIPASEYGEWYVITGSATMLNNLTITVSGSPNSSTVFKFLYSAGMDFNGNTLSIMGYIVQEMYEDKEFTVIANYNGATWDIYFNPDLGQSAVVTSANLVTILDTKTLVTPLLDDTDTGITITSADQTHAAPTATVPNIIDAADTFVMNDTAATLTLKTLTTPTINTGTLATPLIDDGDAGCTVTSADQTHASATATIPNFTGAADSFVMLALAQTLTNKTLTNPTVTTGAFTGPVLTLPEIDNGLTTAQYIVTPSAIAGDRVVTLPLLTAPDTFVFEAFAQTLTSKTLTTPVIASFYQDAGLTQLMTAPNTASDTLVVLAATQTLTNKTIDATVGTNTLTNISPSSRTDDVNSEVITATVDLSVAHTVDIRIPFKCQVPVAPYTIQATTTIDVTIQDALVRIQDDVGGQMLAADMTFAFANAIGDVVNATCAGINNDIAAQDNLKIVVTQGSTGTGAAVFSIPVVRQP